VKEEEKNAVLVVQTVPNKFGFDTESPSNYKTGLRTV